MPKGIFIGLGGAGIITVARLKALLFQRTYDSDKGAMDADCSFIFYDTDSMSVESVSSDVELQKMMKGSPVIDRGLEYVYAGMVSPNSMYQMAKGAPKDDEASQRILEWACDPFVGNKYDFPAKSLEEGTGAQRMAGRMGFAHQRISFERKITTALHILLAQLEQNANFFEERPAIWVFASSNGGTSSSAILDVLYLVDRLYKTHIANVDPYLRLVLYMPKPFIDKNRENSHVHALNAYSTLWELNEFRTDAILNNDGNKFGTFAAQPDNIEWSNLMPWNVCSFVLGVDAESQNGRVTLEQMYNNTAEMCYYLHAGAGGLTMISRLDNDLSMCGPYAHTPRTAFDDPFQWEKFVVGAGYKTITKADDFLKEYIRRRFRYDILKYGLLGLQMHQVLPNNEDIMSAVKIFVEERILKHLFNIDNPERSAPVSLCKHFKDVYDTALPLPLDKLNRQEVDLYLLECRNMVSNLKHSFYNSKESYIEAIQQSVLEGMEESITNYGLLYTYSLLAMVDDEYCERAVMDKLQDIQRRLDLYNMEKDIFEINTNFLFKLFGNNTVALYEKLEQYKDACFLSFVTESVFDIIRDITQDKVGLLEYFRKGESSHLGIRGMIDFVKREYNLSEMACRDIATSFRKSANDICTDYFPPVHEFVTHGEKWEKDNVFERLYDTIVPLNRSSNNGDVDSAGFARIPLRLDIAHILDSIKKQTKANGREFRFTDMLLDQPSDASNHMKRFMIGMDRYIEDAIESNIYPVKAWLNEPLERIFNDYFIKDDGTIDIDAKNKYIYKFNSSIPVFFPQRYGLSNDDFGTRILYVGGSQNFAQTIGYYDCPDKEFVYDPNIGNRFIAFKIDVGLSFYNYKYFDMLKSIYESKKKEIENGEINCHIHKEFLHRDLTSAFKKLQQEHNKH